MTPAPIALFVYDRPPHTQRTLEALAANTLAANSDLVVFADGPRTPAEAAAVAATRDVVRAARGFRRRTLIERPENAGLFRSITDGLGAMARDHERFIVLEDDLVTTPDFLRYMNDGLEAYADTPRVGSIHGYMYPIDGLPDYFFVPGGDCWGWATWRDRWELFQPDARALLQALRARGLVDAFESVGGPQFSRMLARRASGRNQSWAILWHATLVAYERLTLQPGTSFVRNIGMDGSGTHSHETRLFETRLRQSYQGIHAGPVAPDETAMRKMRAYLAPPGFRSALTRLLAWWSARPL